MTKTARPGDHPGTGGGIGNQGSVESPDTTAARPDPQELETAKQRAHAERETLRRVIIATASTATPELLADLRSLWRRAEKRLREARRAIRERGRSAEQTSELQSLMRISYAVFCLKKKK